MPLFSLGTKTLATPPNRNRSANYLGSGLTMIAVVVLFTLGGRWLDGVTGTTPLFLLIGFFLGAAGGFIHLVNAVAPEMLPFGRKAPEGRKPENDTDVASPPDADPDPGDDAPAT